MNARPSNFVNMTVTLVIVTAVAALSLGFVFEVTKAPIEKARIDKQIRAIAAVAGVGENDPLLDAYQGAEGLDVFPVKKEGKVVSKAIKSYSDQGYSGRIELIIGIGARGEILGIQVLEHKETPGLGSKIRDENFKQQYVGQSAESIDFRVKKDGGDIDAISGATISTRAFSEAIELALKDQKEKG